MCVRMHVLCVSTWACMYLAMGLVLRVAVYVHMRVYLYVRLRDYMSICACDW